MNYLRDRRGSLSIASASMQLMTAHSVHLICMKVLTNFSTGCHFSNSFDSIMFFIQGCQYFIIVIIIVIMILVEYLLALTVFQYTVGRSKVVHWFDGCLKEPCL